jgi:hypothetical protein
VPTKLPGGVDLANRSAPQSYLPALRM